MRGHWTWYTDVPRYFLKSGIQNPSKTRIRLLWSINITYSWIIKKREIPAETGEKLSGGSGSLCGHNSRLGVGERSVVEIEKKGTVERDLKEDKV